MSKNTKFEAFKTRMHLLDVAINEFSSRGYTSTTLMDIAASAGVTRGAIYWHFESKIELFNEIWLREQPIYQQVSRDVLVTDVDNPLFTLKELFVNALKFVASDTKQRNLMNIIFHKCEFSHLMLSSQDIRHRIYINPKRLEGMLDECKSRHQLPASLNVEQAVNMIRAYFTGIIGNWLVYPDVFNLYKDAERIVSQLIFMLSYKGNDREGVELTGESEWVG